MLTAPYLANHHEFRPEFRTSLSDCGMGLAVDVQPIDAPTTICAGSNRRIQSMSGEFYYDLPTTISR